MAASRLTAPRAVIFDWDNTLVDTWPLIHGALEETFVKYGLAPWTMEETKDRVAHSLRDSFPALFGEKWQQAGADYQAFYQRDHLTRLNVLPQAEDLLSKLQKQGVYMAVVSNKKGHNLRKEAEHLGWNHYFGHLVGADDAEQDKPHPAPVRMALEGSGIEAGAGVWFIGDTAIDLECAHNSGCVAVLFGEAEPQSQEKKLKYRGFEVDVYARTHQQLLDTVQAVF